MHLPMLSPFPVASPGTIHPGHAFEGDVARFIRQGAAQQRHGDLWGGVKDVLLQATDHPLRFGMVDVDLGICFWGWMG